MTTFYLVMSTDGLEGSFTTRPDAEEYLRELRDIGVTGLRIATKDIAENRPPDPVCPRCHRAYPFGDPRALVSPPRQCFDCDERDA